MPRARKAPSPDALDTPAARKRKYTRRKKRGESALPKALREESLPHSVQPFGATVDLPADAKPPRLPDYVPFTLSHFVSKFDSDPLVANEIVAGIVGEITGEDERLKKIHDLFNDLDVGPREDRRLFDKLCRKVELASDKFVGYVTAAAFRMGRNLAYLTMALKLGDVVEATADYGINNLEAGGDRERMLKASGMIVEKGATVNVNTQVNAQMNVAQQQGGGMCLPRLGETTAAIHDEVMADRRRMLEPAKQDFIEVERVKDNEREEVYEPTGVR